MNDKVGSTYYPGNDKVWFTYKARIQAQQRLANNDFHSQVILVWYALLSTVFAIVTLRYPKAIGAETDMVSAALSVVLLVMSMLVANRDFRGRSIAMRNNYLALQTLYSQLGEKRSEEDNKRYQVLLDSNENHTELDDKVFRVLHYWTLDSRKPKFIEFADVYGYLSMRMLILALMYLGPLVIAYFWAIR